MVLPNNRTHMKSHKTFKEKGRFGGSYSHPRAGIQSIPVLCSSVTTRASKSCFVLEAGTGLPHREQKSEPFGKQQAYRSDGAQLHTPSLQAPSLCPPLPRGVQGLSVPLSSPSTRLPSTRGCRLHSKPISSRSTPDLHHLTAN